MANKQKTWKGWGIINKRGNLVKYPFSSRPYYCATKRDAINNAWKGEKPIKIEIRICPKEQ